MRCCLWPQRKAFINNSVVENLGLNTEIKVRYAEPVLTFDVVRMHQRSHSVVALCSHLSWNAMALADGCCVHFRCQMSLAMFKKKLTFASFQRVPDSTFDKDGVPSYWFVKCGYDFRLVRGNF